MDQREQNERPNTGISAVIISYNTARTIGRCLQAVAQVTDETLVLDSFSDDGTVELCRQYGARVIPQEWLGYAATKNLGQDMAENDWILSIDADEILSEELIASLRSLQRRRGEAYALDRLTSFCGKWIYHCGWYPERKIRLFHRDEVRWGDELVHETLRMPAHCKVVRLRGKLYHDSFADENDHWRRLRKYARLSAEELLRQGRRPTWVHRYLSPAARFSRTYFLKLGFLDGRAGWIISVRSARMVYLRYRLLDAMWRLCDREKVDEAGKNSE